jgi:uncharacterized protein YkwD
VELAEEQQAFEPSKQLSFASRIQQRAKKGKVSEQLRWSTEASRVARENSARQTRDVIASFFGGSCGSI